MKTLLKAVPVSLLLAGAVFATAHAQAQDPRTARSDAPTHYAEGETQTILEWQRLVEQANQYRYRQAAEAARRTAASQTESH